MAVELPKGAGGRGIQLDTAGPSGGDSDSGDGTAGRPCAGPSTAAGTAARRLFPPRSAKVVEVVDE